MDVVFSRIHFFGVIFFSLSHFICYDWHWICFIESTDLRLPIGLVWVYGLKRRAYSYGMCVSLELAITTTIIGMSQRLSINMGKRFDLYGVLVRAFTPFQRHTHLMHTVCICFGRFVCLCIRYAPNQLSFMHLPNTSKTGSEIKSQTIESKKNIETRVKSVHIYFLIQPKNICNWIIYRNIFFFCSFTATNPFS